jgi:dGTPase
LNATLAIYACDPAQSRGRRIYEPTAPTRTDFQRDRDRIVHSTAFRRLVYKTQVFLNHEGDLFRTRLTHSLEVAQLARSIARSLALNEDLVEAISLAHDLGHTPFGHAGQDALHECMASFGGFEHNLQSLRVVDKLEERYPNFDGLNLTFETREGILKHCSSTNAKLLEATEPAYADGEAGIGGRFLLRHQPGLEAQLCNLADEIAYNAHDIDDGVRSGLITTEQLRDVAQYEEFQQAALNANPHLRQANQSRRLLYESIRLMLSSQVYDVIHTTQQALQEIKPQSVHDVRKAAPIVMFSQPMQEKSKQLKKFLFQHLYRHPKVEETMAQARQVVRELFAIYCETPSEMQAMSAAKAESDLQVESSDPMELTRAVADYIAGMTDRFAAREHERLSGKRLIA